MKGPPAGSSQLTVRLYGVAAEMVGNSPPGSLKVITAQPSIWFPTAACRMMFSSPSVRLSARGVKVSVVVSLVRGREW